ncbi:MAG TPA: prolipoprotein diacylglyceryl transferase [Steroidobacteraceae bacterium]
MLEYPGFDPVAFEIGPFFGVGPLRVHWYGIMYLIGFGVAWYLARRRAAQPGSSWKANDVDDFIFYGMLGVIIGGRVGYVLFYGLEFWARDIWYPIKIWEGGMSFHGGMLGVIAAALIFAWRRGRHAADVFDFAVPLPGIGIMAGRIGNFINGELWGKPTTLPWGMNVNGVVRHPSQLYEAALEGLVLFIILWWFTSKPRPRWAPSGLFLVLYSVARFSVEFVRMPDENLNYLAGGWLTMGQLLSTPMFIAGVALLILAYRKRAPSGNFAVAR